jgi:hypothetical protein
MLRNRAMDFTSLSHLGSRLALAALALVGPCAFASAPEVERAKQLRAQSPHGPMLERGVPSLRTIPGLKTDEIVRLLQQHARRGDARP